ncbi:MAG TPA: PEP-CTERM sorting domain-containing protein [Thiobacillaceae bacterium]|nr:PEP-CTERM sorting domain-containing protein [Thiobacillaceae bacterium]
MKKNALFAALLAGACLSHPALAASYQITVSGTLDKAFSGTHDPGFGHDLTGWLGMSYSLSFILDNDPANAIALGTEAWDDVPGNIDHWWAFDPSGVYKVRLVVDGVSVLSGNDFYSNGLVSMNDQWVPAGPPELPSGIPGDRAYDGLFLETGHFVGCEGGAACDWNNPNIVYEHLWIGADHVWSDLASIPDNNLPDLLNAAPSFAGAVYASVFIEAGRWSPNGLVDTTVYAINGRVDSVTVTPVPAAPVPEPETYALLLAGLGLVGWRLRGRC